VPNRENGQALLANEFPGQRDGLKMVAEAIQKNEKWLLESGS
jgi:hypothetical protein